MRLHTHTHTQSAHKHAHMHSSSRSTWCVAERIFQKSNTMKLLCFSQKAGKPHNNGPNSSQICTRMERCSFHSKRWVETNILTLRRVGLKKSSWCCSSVELCAKTAAVAFSGPHTHTHTQQLRAHLKYIFVCLIFMIMSFCPVLPCRHVEDSFSQGFRSERFCMLRCLATNFHNFLT